MISGRHFQNAYVTSDIDSAVVRLQAGADVRRLLQFDATSNFTTPRGPEPQSIRMAFLWVGDLQYEIIQPVSGAIGIFEDFIKPNGALTFHHAAMRIDEDWDGFRAGIDRQPFEVVLEGGGPEQRFLFLDARPLLGHHIEYTWMTPERWAQSGGR